MTVAPAPAVPAATNRRLRWLSVTAVVMAMVLGLYLFGPLWPGVFGRLQLATRESWGWAGPGEIEVRAVPAEAWIEIESAYVPGEIQGQGLVRAKVTAGVYHCRVRLDGYEPQSFDLRCVPDARVTRSVTLERQR
jgi:hypothetical protein